MQFEESFEELDIYDQPILTAQQFDLAQLAGNIASRGAKVGSKIYNIGPLTESSRIAADYKPTYLWSKTLDLTTTADRTDLAYGAAAKNLDVCYVWLYSRFDNQPILPFRSNLWSYLDSIGHPERPVQGRVDTPLYIPEVSIYLTTDGKFLEPKMIDVVTLSLDAGTTAQLKANLLTAMNQGSSYDVVVFENGRDFVKPLLKQRDGLMRSVILPR